MEVREFFWRLQRTSEFGVSDYSELETALQHLDDEAREHVVDYITRCMPSDISDELEHWASCCFFTPELLLQYVEEYDQEDEPLSNFRELPFFRIGGMQSDHAFGIDVRTGEFVDYDEALLHEQAESREDYVENRSPDLQSFILLFDEFFGGDFPFDGEDDQPSNSMDDDEDLDDLDD